MKTSTSHRCWSTLLLLPAAFLAGTSLPGCSAQVDARRKSSATAGALDASPATDMPTLLRLYDVDQRSVGGFYDLPWSIVRFQRLENLNRDWAERLQASDFDPLDQQGRIDYLLLRNRLESERAHLTLDRQHLAEME